MVACVLCLQARSDLLSRFREDSRFILLSKDDVNHGSTEALRDAMLNFIIAGRDTSAVALSWFLYLVSLHSRVEEKILAELLAFESEVQHVVAPSVHSAQDDELDAEVHKFAHSLTYEALGKMQYLHAAVTEAARIYPPVPMVTPSLHHLSISLEVCTLLAVDGTLQDTKMCLTDDTLPDGTIVKKGDFVAYSAYCMGRLERLWGADASEFKPERWLKGGVFQPESQFKFVTFHVRANSASALLVLLHC